MRYLAFDVETGGLGIETSLLTAYFEVLDSSLVTLASLDLTLVPDNGVYQVTSQGLGINKIDLVEHGKTAIKYKEAKTVLYNFLQEHYRWTNQKLVPIGQNVSFDIEHICTHLLSKASWETFVSHRALDTMYIARFLQVAGLLSVEDLSLQNLVKHFNIVVLEGTAHEAMYDTRCTVKVLKSLLSLAQKQ